MGEKMQTCEDFTLSKSVAGDLTSLLCLYSKKMSPKRLYASSAEASEPLCVMGSVQ